MDFEYQVETIELWHPTRSEQIDHISCDITVYTPSHSSQPAKLVIELDDVDELIRSLAPFSKSIVSITPTD